MNDEWCDYKEELPGYEFVRYLYYNRYATTILMRYGAESRVVKISHVENVYSHTKELFLQEAHLLQRCMQHPNIIRLLDFKQTRDNYILITEYANSKDLLFLLNQHIAYQIPIKPVIIYSIIGQLAKALAFLKEEKIIHRDIKPANIFLSKNSNNYLIVKLGDFGISKCLEATDHAQTIIGTLNYISPELAGYEKYSFASDAWSLGVTLYEVVKGKNPFHAESTTEMLYNIVSGRFQPLDSGLHDVDSIVHGLLIVDPEKRLAVEYILERKNIKKVLSLLNLD